MRQDLYALRPLCAVVVAMTLVAGGCQDEGESNDVLSLADLRSRAAYTVQDSDEYPIADAIGLHPLGEDSLLVVDGVEPFVKVYGRGGRLTAASVRKGEGPGEISTSTPGVMLNNALYIVDRGTGQMLHLALDSMQERARHAVPFTAVALFEGCGGLSAMLQLVRPQRDADGRPTHDVQNYAPIHFDGESWTLPEREWPSMDFAPSPNEWRTAVRGDTIVWHNAFFNRLELLGCDGSLLHRGPGIPYPDSWRIPPAPRGLVWLDDEVTVLFTGAARALQDTTYIARWRPADGHAEIRKVAGRLQLHARHGDMLWLVDNDVIPVPFAISVADWTRWLEGN